jgi:hypothetical protein
MLLFWCQWRCGGNSLRSNIYAAADIVSQTCVEQCAPAVFVTGRILLTDCGIEFNLTPGCNLFFKTFFGCYAISKTTFYEENECSQTISKICTVTSYGLKQ